MICHWHVWKRSVYSCIRHKDVLLTIGFPYLCLTNESFFQFFIKLRVKCRIHAYIYIRKSRLIFNFIKLLIKFQPVFPTSFMFVIRLTQNNPNICLIVCTRFGINNI